MKTSLTDAVQATRRVGCIALRHGCGNVVVSPSSIVCALAALADGATGHSLVELTAVLGGDRSAVRRLQAAVSRYDGDPSVVRQASPPKRPLVHLAQRFVVHDSLMVKPGVSADRADLFSPAAGPVLDAWVREHTGGLIQKSAIVPAPGLLMVLQDAVVLAARWRETFSRSATHPRRFTLGDGTDVQTPTMWSQRPVPFGEIDGWKSVRLPYTEGLHADLLLPPDGVDPATLDASMWDGLSRHLDHARDDLTEITLPTLDMTPDALDLVPVISAAGAPSIFDPRMSTLTELVVADDALYAGEAVQRAVLRADEEGTVAAAVTEFGLRAAGLPPRPVRAVHFDRPYVFTVVHTETAWPLFVAAVHDPRH